MRSARVLACCAIAAATLGVAACGSDSKDTNAPTVTAGTSGAQVEIGNTINYGSFGTTADIDCADGKSLNVGGSNNTLTVKGTCASVNIGGADNKITFRNVKTGPRVDTMWVIEEGLKPGEQVVAEGLQAVSEGMTVRTKPMGAAETAKTAGTSGEAK